jgi:hypothetical protein
LSALITFGEEKGNQREHALSRWDWAAQFVSLVWTELR